MGRPRKINRLDYSQFLFSSQTKVTMELKCSMLEKEDQIQRYVNQVGVVATNEALARFETTGAPIQMGSVKMTAFKKKQKKEYNSLFDLTGDHKSPIYESVYDSL